MQKKIVNNKKISAMTLGTVQLGMNYGIANQSGQPDTEKSRKMLRAAIDSGINSFDTARAYGTSEEVLGGFFKQEKPSDLFVTSKLIVDLPEDAKYDDVEKEMFSAVEDSLKTLGLNKLDCLMLHRGYEMTKHGSFVPDTFEKLITKGYIDVAGVSIYTGSEIDTMLTMDVFGAVQVPMNVFDMRLIAKGYPAKLKEKNIAVFVRSVFLQGLFFLDPASFTDPDFISYIKPYSEKLRAFCSEAGMTIPEFAISFIRDIPGVTSLVLGAETEEQIAQNVAYMNAPAIPQNLRCEIEKEFQNVNMDKIMEILSRPRK